MHEISSSDCQLSRQTRQTMGWLGRWREKPLPAGHENQLHDQVHLFPQQGPRIFLFHRGNSQSRGCCGLKVCVQTNLDAKKLSE